MNVSPRIICWRLVNTLLLLLPLFAQANVDPLSRGFDHYYNLEYDQAIVDFDAAAKADPKAASPHYHVAQTLLYREMFRKGALESDLVGSSNSFLSRPKLELAADDAKRFEAEAAKAEELAQTRLHANANDVEGLYDSCVVNALRSNYDFLVRKAWKDALRGAAAARKLCSRVIEIDSSNYDARLVPAVYDYVVGSLPWYYQSLGFIAGFRGDRDRGIATLEEVAAKSKKNGADAEFLLTALYRRERLAYKAVPLVARLERRYPRNYLLGLEKAAMYSAAGEKLNALAAADQIAEKKQARAPGYAGIPWGKIWYAKAGIQFGFRDLDGALENFRKAADSGKDLDLNSSVTARLRMGQILDLKNKHDQAVEEYKKAIAMAPDSEVARESKRYMDKPYRRIPS
jgi:tetratricopeptide (TPR) repeat protein